MGLQECSCESIIHQTVRASHSFALRSSFNFPRFRRRSCWLTFESHFIFKRSSIHSGETVVTAWIACTIATAHGSLLILRCESRILHSIHHGQFRLGLMGIESVLFPLFSDQAVMGPLASTRLVVLSLRMAKASDVSMASGSSRGLHEKTSTAAKRCSGQVWMAT